MPSWKSKHESNKSSYTETIPLLISGKVNGTDDPSRIVENEIANTTCTLYFSSKGDTRNVGSGRNQEEQHNILSTHIEDVVSDITQSTMDIGGEDETSNKERYILISCQWQNWMSTMLSFISQYLCVEHCAWGQGSKFNLDFIKACNVKMQFWQWLSLFWVRSWFYLF